MGELSSHSSLCSELRWNSASEQTSLPFIVRRAGQESLSWLCQLCPTLCNSVDCCPGSSVHGISQASILERAAISSSRGPSRPRDWSLSHWQVDSLLLSHLGSPELLRASLHWSAKWGMMMGNPLPHPGLYQGRLKIKMNPPLDTRGEKK